MALRSGIGIIEETDKEKNKKKTITRNVRGVESKAIAIAGKKLTPLKK